MERVDAFFASVAEFIGNPQFPIIAFTTVVVTAGVLWGKRWYVNRSNGGHARRTLTDAMAVIAPYLAGLAIIGLGMLA